MNFTLQARKLIKVLRCLLGLVFAAAGLLKLLPLSGFLHQVRAYALPLPVELWHYGSAILIAFEIWVGLSLFFGSNLRLAIVGAQLLLLGMIPITIWGHFNHAPTCGCYGSLVKREPIMATIEDAILLVISLFLDPFIAAPLRPSLQGWIKAIIIGIITLVTLAWGLVQASEELALL